MSVNTAKDNSASEIIQKHINYLQRVDPHPSPVISNQIIPRLYLGSVGAAYNEQTLDSFNITHILTICDCLPPKFPQVIPIQKYEYKVVNIHDDPRANIGLHFNTCTEYLNRTLTSGSTVLVHCFAGVSRSATIVLAYLMKYQGRSLNNSMEYTQKCRPVIKPNFGFMDQLRRYNNHLHSKKNKKQCQY